MITSPKGGYQHIPSPWGPKSDYISQDIQTRQSFWPWNHATSWIYKFIKSGRTPPKGPKPNNLYISLGTKPDHLNFSLVTLSNHYNASQGIKTKPYSHLPRNDTRPSQLLPCNIIKPSQRLPSNDPKPNHLHISYKSPKLNHHYIWKCHCWERIHHYVTGITKFTSITKFTRTISVWVSRGSSESQVLPYSPESSS